MIILIEIDSLLVPGMEDKHKHKGLHNLKTYEGCVTIYMANNAMQYSSNPKGTYNSETVRDVS